MYLFVALSSKSRQAKIICEVVVSIHVSIVESGSECQGYNTCTKFEEKALDIRYYLPFFPLDLTSPSLHHQHERIYVTVLY